MKRFLWCTGIFKKSQLWCIVLQLMCCCLWWWWKRCKIWNWWGNNGESIYLSWYIFFVDKFGVKLTTLTVAYFSLGHRMTGQVLESHLAIPSCTLQVTFYPDPNSDLATLVTQLDDLCFLYLDFCVDRLYFTSQITGIYIVQRCAIPSPQLIRF